MLPISICPKEKDLSVINNNISCPEEGCLSTFTNSSNLEMHLIKTHNKESSYLEKKNDIMYRYYCPVDTCKYYLHHDRTQLNSRYFSKMKFLKQHYQKVHKSKAYDCPSEKCYKKFTTEKELTYHMEECGKKFICSVCSFTYSSRLSLLTHAKKKNHIQTNHRLLKRTEATSVSPVKSCAVVTNFNNIQNHQILFPRITSDSLVNIAAAALSELSSKIVVKGVDKGVQATSRRRSCSDRILKKNISSQTQTRISAQTQTTTRYSNNVLTETNKHSKSSETQTLQDTDNAVDSEDSIFSNLNRNKCIINIQNFCNFGTQTNVPSNISASVSNLMDIDVNNTSNKTNSSLKMNLSEISSFANSNNQLNGYRSNLEFETNGNFSTKVNSDLNRVIPLTNAQMEVEDLELNLLDNSQQFDGLIQQNTMDIQTQTELNFLEPLLSHNCTQTFYSAFEDFFRNNCTQTYNNGLNDNVDFADIETQTIFADLSKVSVDTETQTVI